MLATVFGLQPVLVFAAFETPSSLFDAIRMDASARTIKGEVHGNMEGSLWMSAWFDAAQEGKNLENGKANVKMTVDVVETKQNMKGRIKLEMRVVDQKMFMKLDQAEGSFENENVMATANVVLKKWIEVPLEKDGRDIVGEIDDMDSSFANEMFDLAHVQSAFGHTYTLTLKPSVLQDILSDMQGGSADFSMNVNTNLSDLFQTGKVTLNFTSETASVRGNATMQRSNTPLSIVAPADAVNIEELYQDLPSAFGVNPFDSYMDIAEPAYPSDEWEVPAEDWQWEEEMEEEPVAPSIQRGIKPSRRSIRETVRTQREATRRPSVKPANTSSSTLDDHGLVIGRSSAPITIVEFGDYECPFCGTHFSTTMPKIMKEYIDTGKVRYVFRNYPLSFHPGAMPAAIAVECALKQGNLQAVELHDAIYTAVGGGLELTMENIQDWAKNVDGIATPDFNTCTDNEETADLVEADIEEGTEAGVMGTPSFFILGPAGETKQITGAYPIDEFRRVIDEILGE